MEYTALGKTGLTVSRFGLGLMRLPKDEKQAIELIRYAIDHGVNYLDTAYVYDGSEAVTGKALKDGYRQKVFLASKSPVWKMEKPSDLEDYLDQSLQRLGTEYLDIYHLHNLNPAHWDMVKRFDALNFLDKMIRKGKIRHKTFSIHNTFDAFKEIIDAFDWEAAQIQMNILDENQQVTMQGLQYAAAKGVPVIVMEPLRGGSLLTDPPSAVLDLIDKFPVKRSLAEWCFRWLYDKPEVQVILSGTSTLEQLKDNLRIFADTAPGVMSKEERLLLIAMQNVYDQQKTIPCTACNYCQPCPQNVNIPKIFEMYNRHQHTKPHVLQKTAYLSELILNQASADLCVGCGHCEEQCPQKLPVMDMLKVAHEELAMK